MNQKDTVLGTTRIPPLYLQPNYTEWMGYESWSCEDFAALLVGINPHEVGELATKITNKSLFFDLLPFLLTISAEEVELRFKKYRILHNRLQRTKLFQTSEKKVTPQKCLNWAAENKVTIPIKISQLHGATTVENREIINPRGETRSINNIKKCLTVICNKHLKDKYGIPSFEADSSSISKLLTMFANEGFTIDDQTLRRYLVKDSK